MRMTAFVPYLRLKLTIFLLCCFVLLDASAQDTALPQIRTTLTGETADGDIYLATLRRNTTNPDTPNTAQRHLLIVNNEGDFVYSEPTERIFNFGLTPDGNRYYYTFTENGPGRGASTDGVYRVIDADGTLLREYHVQGDYPTQAHEIIWRENGNIVLLSQPLREADLTAYDGAPDALVSEAVIQEQTPDGEVVFEWRSWEHVTLTDTVNPEELTRTLPESVSYLHANALTVDRDGHYILSARRFDALLKIDSETGEILWRMGGQNAVQNDFVYIDDPLAGFAGQHHVQILPNGNVLLFDNGIADSDHPARAVEYQLDEENRIATLVWSFSDLAGRVAPAMGSAQRLPNGNTLINWGSAEPTAPTIVEVTPANEVVFTLTLPPNLITYRAYRFAD